MLPEALEIVSQEINSKMSEELSVGKDTLVIATFTSIFCATPPLCTPKMSNTFPQLKDYLVSLHHFTLRGKFADINNTKKLWFTANSSLIKIWNKCSCAKNEVSELAQIRY